MKKVLGLNEFAQMVSEDELYRNHIRKAERAFKKDRTNELIAEGVDPEIAAVMASVGL